MQKVQSDDVARTCTRGICVRG